MGLDAPAAGMAATEVVASSRNTATGLRELARHPIRWPAALRRRWRRSLHVRVVVLTMLLGVLVISLLGTYLYRQIGVGLEGDRLRVSRYEAENLRATAQRQWDDNTSATVADLNIAATDIMESYLSPPAGDVSRYVLFVRGVTNTRPTVLAMLQSGEVGLSSITDELRAAVAAQPSRQQTQTITATINGEQVRAIVVGSQVEVPSAGPYDLYFVYPLQREAATMDLIARSFALAGLILTLLVGAVAWVVTRQVVTPVRDAAGIAERFAAGQLGERMATRGEDDLALLGTSFNVMADGIQAQIRQLEGLSRLQQRFVSDVSHELRTPLTTVRMAADLLHDSREDLDPVLSRSVELLHGELDRFEALLADLLEISRYDAGAANLEPEPVDVATTLRRVVDAARPLADRRGSTVTIEVHGAAALAEVDERRVERILRNLVVNAIEHGEGKAIRCEVAADDEAVAVVVADKGVGLRPGEASLVFNRFWRADPARARTTGGTGLGLAISLEDAHLHGGWLQAWGAAGKGSRFRLTLPRLAGAPLTSSPLTLEPKVKR